ncbi:hypothetical protein AB836_01655 [Rickettsiales bacterium (ex Bugula neritina AB1)]|nr:hypothetical protein AB836_01655 [Rickettsiales bacterium (ex Bugula neritina AB1)]
MKKFISIYGPTASGKTDLGIEIANKTNGIIVNFDSCQFRNHLHSFTMCPIDLVENRDFLFNFLEPEENFSCGDFLERLKSIIDTYKNRTIILVGGTGFYLFCALQGISKDKSHNCSQIIDPNKTYEEKFQLLQSLEGNVKIHKNDHYRIDRHLNFFLKYGYSINNRTSAPLILKKDMINIYLKPNKETLITYITERLKKNFFLMIKEAKIVKYHKKFSRIIGYDDIIKYINFEISFEDAFNKIIQKTLKYSKQQKTFFNKKIQHDYIFEEKCEYMKYILYN